MITRRSVFTKMGAALCGLFAGRASGATSDMALERVQKVPYPASYKELGAGSGIKRDILFRESSTHPGEVEYDGVLHADNRPFSQSVEVFNRNTGEVQRNVQSVDVEGGWIDQITMFLPAHDAPAKCVVVNGKLCYEPWPGLVIHRIYGNWGLRYKP
jgi:hypothetical protein